MQRRGVLDISGPSSNWMLSTAHLEDGNDKTRDRFADLMKELGTKEGQEMLL
jgi:hypothetical protein